MRIDTRVAERLKKVNPSLTLALTAKAKKMRAEGQDVVNLSAGEPDFDTPDFIKEKAIEAINSGFTKYTPSSGIPSLKKLICEKFKKDNRLEYDSSQIIVSCGAKHSIFNALQALVNKNDEVLIPSPYWVSYPEMVNICEGIPRFVKASRENNFKITPEELKKYISAKTKLLILNSPANPTGAVYSKEELQEIANICVGKNIFVISDEIYEKIIFDNLKPVSIASFNREIYNLTITVNGLSKSHSMTGWRIGYLGAAQDIADAISKLQDHSTSCPSSISQKAAEAALSGPEDFSNMIRQEFQERRDYVVSRIKKMHKIKCVVPQGAFYIFCDISATAMDSDAFAAGLLEEEKVSLIPGKGFGLDTNIRISFATSEEELRKGMDRLEEWVSKI